MRTTLTSMMVVISSSFLAGCATEPRDPPLPEIQNTVNQRAGLRVTWHQGSVEDQAVYDAVHRLMQKELTVDESAQIALLNNRNLQAIFEELGITQAELVGAGLLKNPVLSAEVRFPDSPFEIDVFQDVLDVFLLPLRKRVAEADFEAAKLRVTHEVLDLWSETRLAYFALQGAEQMLELRRSIATATEASASAAKAMHDAGNITDLDYASETALHDDAKIELARAEAEVQDARERLNALMGLWGRDVERWTVVRRLPEPPEADVPPAGLESLAISQRLDLAAARQEIESLARSYGLTRFAALIPEVNVGGHLEREPEGDSTVGPSIEFPLPIFNQGQGDVARAQAQLRQAQQRFLARAVEIRSEVRVARNRMLNARSRAQYYRRVALPRRHTITQQTQLQYNAMQVGVVQLLQAKQGEIDAGRAYVEALQDYWTARTQLEKAVGGRLHIGGTAAATRPATPPTTPTTQPDESQSPQPRHQHHQGG